MKVHLGVERASPPGGVGSLVADGRLSGWRAVARVLRSSATTLIDDVVTTVFPADCRCCEGPLTQAGVVPVCKTCVGRVRRSSIVGCHICGDGIDAHIDFEDQRLAESMAASLVCRECALARPEFVRAVSFGVYDGEMRELIHLLKFERVSSVARLLGGRMAEAMLQLEGVAAAELMVVAVPLFRARERQRGYNQSVLLADEAVRQLKRMRPHWRLTRAHDVIKRHRSTESSFVLSRRGRRRNLTGAFRVEGEVRGREVLLVDDILTSGATARECARVLMRAGAAKVWVVTLARAQKTSVMTLHEDLGDQVAAWDRTAVAHA